MIVILKGGISAEREVSLWTAASVAEALQALGREYVEVDAADTDWLTKVEACRPEVVLIALHGPFGEDGSVQKILEERDIPFTGTGAEASKVTISKVETKQVAAKVGITVAESQVYEKGQEVVWSGSYPVVVKPNGDGSSFGVTIVHTIEGLLGAVERAFEVDSHILLEEYIAGTEVSCGVISWQGKLRALPLVEIRPVGEFFDFNAKYKGNCLEICPAEVPQEQTALVQELTLRVFEALNCEQYARADWIIKDGTPYFLEINTLPGMTKTSLLPQELTAAGIKYAEFIEGLIAGAKQRGR